MSNTKAVLLVIFLSFCITPLLSQLIKDRINLVKTAENSLSNLKNIAQGSEEFALDIFRRISQAVSTSPYDFMISPFSIWSLLVLVAEGARGNTLLELQKALRISNDQLLLREGYKQIQKALSVNTSTIEVSSLQAVFSDMNRPVDREYENIIERSYHADLIPVDFHKIADAQNNINNYVNKATRGLIDYVVNEDDLKDAQMVLISAIFFKGQWTTPFNRSLTKEELFYDENGNAQGNVDMMFQRGSFPYTAIANLDTHVLEIPYGKENRLSMLIFLPRKGASLTSVIEKLSSYGIGNIYRELHKAMQDFDEDEIEVYLPKFTTTSDFALNIILEQMGILDLFDAYKADLSKISVHPIFLSRILHKTKIEVNEEGTVASAATGGIFANKATPPRFYVNRPFAYIIIEKSTNSLVFCGQVRNPTKKSRSN